MSFLRAYKLRGVSLHEETCLMSVSLWRCLTLYSPGHPKMVNTIEVPLAVPQHSANILTLYSPNRITHVFTGKAC